MGCCVTVPQSEVGMVEQCGKFNREAQAGLTFLWCPCGERIGGTVSLRVQQLNLECDTKTRDNVFVTLVVSVQYQCLVDNLFDAYYRLTNPHEQITAYIYDVVRASVPKITLDEVFETKEEIAQTVKEELCKVMEDYGYHIIQALITDIRPDDTVQKAMNEINAAERLKEAAKSKAEAEKIMMVKAAEAESESKYLAGVGISRERMAIVDGLRDSVLGFTDNVEGATTKDVMDLVLITQYFDTLKEIGASHKSNIVFVPHSGGGGEGMADQIRDGLLQAGSMGKKRN